MSTGDVQPRTQGLRGYSRGVYRVGGGSLFAVMLGIDENDDIAAYHNTECNSPAKATARVKEIFCSGAEGIDVNPLSPDEGGVLLSALYSNYRLQEESSVEALDLLKFLSEKGADPNLECVWDNQTAFGRLDYDGELEHMTPE